MRRKSLSQNKQRRSTHVIIIIVANWRRRCYRYGCVLLPRWGRHRDHLGLTWRQRLINRRCCRSRPAVTSTTNTTTAWRTEASGPARRLHAAVTRVNCLKVIDSTLLIGVSLRSYDGHRQLHLAIQQAQKERGNSIVGVFIAHCRQQRQGDESGTSRLRSLTFSLKERAGCARSFIALPRIMKFSPISFLTPKRREPCAFPPRVSAPPNKVDEC